MKIFLLLFFWMTIPAWGEEMALGRVVYTDPELQRISRTQESQWKELTFTTVYDDPTLVVSDRDDSISGKLRVYSQCSFILDFNRFRHGLGWRLEQLKVAQKNWEKTGGLPSLNQYLPADDRVFATAIRVWGNVGRKLGGRRLVVDQSGEKAACGDPYTEGEMGKKLDLENLKLYDPATGKMESFIGWFEKELKTTMRDQELADGYYDPSRIFLKWWDQLRGEGIFRQASDQKDKESKEDSARAEPGQLMEIETSVFRPR